MRLAKALIMLPPLLRHEYLIFLRCENPELEPGWKSRHSRLAWQVLNRLVFTLRAALLPFTVKEVACEQAGSDGEVGPDFVRLRQVAFVRRRKSAFEAKAVKEATTDVKV